MNNNNKLKMPRFFNNFHNIARQIWFVQTFKTPASNKLMKTIIQQNVFNKHTVLYFLIEILFSKTKFKSIFKVFFCCQAGVSLHSGPMSFKLSLGKLFEWEILFKSIWYLFCYSVPKSEQNRPANSFCIRNKYLF